MRRGVPKDRLTWLRLALALGMIAGLLFSPKLWVSTRVYPLTPLFDIISPLAYPADYALFGLLAALVAGAGIVRGRWAGWCALGAVAVAAFLVLQDQTRLQPWFYQYSFMLAAVGLSGLGRLSTEGTLNACRLIVAFTYLWSGLQKANESFVSGIYPWVIEPLAHHLSAGVQDAPSYGAYVVPAIEAAIGLGLLARPTHKPAAVGALLMHAFLLLCLGPWGRDWNSVVWPWNIAMVVFVFVLFWKPADAPPLLTVLNPHRSAFSAVVLLFFAFMPLLSFFGLWDSYLSSSLYSGNIEQGLVLTWDGSRWVGTDMANLTVEEMNVAAYPEDRVFKNVFAKTWCDRGLYPEPRLLVRGKPAIVSSERPAKLYGCDDISVT